MWSTKQRARPSSEFEAGAGGGRLKHAGPAGSGGREGLHIAQEQQPCCGSTPAFAGAWTRHAPPTQFLCMLLRRSSKGSSQSQAALQLLLQQLPQFVDASPRTALAHPAFWQLAGAAAQGSPGLSQDLTLLGYDLEAAAAVATQQLQQVQQLLGLDAAQLQQQLLAELKASSSILLPEQQPQLLQAVGGNAAARALLGQLQLVEVLAACCGLSAVQLCLPPCSSELVRRLTGRGPAAPPASEQLLAAIREAAPALVAAVRQLPSSSMARPGVSGLLQLLDSKPELQVRRVGEEGRVWP